MRPRTWLAAAGLAGTAIVLAAAAEDTREQPPAPPDTGAVRDCRSRGEPSGRPGPAAIRIGPVALPGGFERSPPSTFAKLADQIGFRRYLRGRRGRALPPAERRRLARLARLHHGALKFGVHVRAGERVVLAVAPADRAHAALLFEYRRGRRIGPYRSLGLSDGAAAVALEACHAGEPRFGGPGTVGPYTAFPGAAIVAGARCVRFQVWVDRRERPFEREVPFGVNGCPPPGAAR